MRIIRIVLLGWLIAGASAFANEDLALRYPQLYTLFPEAERFSPLEGEPPATRVTAAGNVVGYAFLTTDVVSIPAYSGRPITSLVGIDMSGRITGISILAHEEPILAIGISDERLNAFTSQYRGLSVEDRVAVGAERAGHVSVDTISGATITAMVQNQTVMLAARLVAESRGLVSSLGMPAMVQPRSPHNPLAGRGQGTPVPGFEAAQQASGEPLWKGVWRERSFSIGALVFGLVVLVAILLFQDLLARYPRLLGIVRRAFLAYTVVFIGWYALAQLSIVHVLTFLHAAVRDFRWETFLIDPMLFILWTFVAMTLLLWGRGVYCGWLCPFGALQELTQQVSRKLRVRQFEFPDVVHERLWGLKYVVLIVLFGVSLQSMGEAARLAEVEPFKTAFTLRFAREAPFVLYALGLIALSLFNRKFFCKYLCPLGAALSIPGRFRVFDWWLRRRKECGRPCQTCAHDCEVRAIRATGEINANECHYCLDCQVTYYNDRRCPPLIERRTRREQRARKDPDRLTQIKFVKTSNI